MTDEEIKQAALEYRQRTDNPDDSIGRCMQRQEDFIAGAHSRDEEIEELEFKIMKLKHERNLYRSAYRLCQRKE